MEEAPHWFLTPDERGNAATWIDRRRGTDGWTLGNHVEALVHGRAYFERLVGCLRELRTGDRLWFTDWRGDADEVLAADGTRLGDLLAELAGRGVEVRGLLWRSHTKLLGFSEEEHVQLADQVNEAGGQILLDHRVRRAGSHHQKVVILQHPARHELDVAFVGGIDLCHGRGDDERHLGDVQAESLDEQYGPTPPWHDVQAEVRGPAVGDLAHTFAERWNDRTPLDDTATPWQWIRTKLARQPTRPDPLPPLDPPPPAAGGHAVQVLRTYPVRRPAYPFAPRGERSVARAYHKAFRRARGLIYVEDQYFWSAEVADAFCRALVQAPELKVIVVVPRVPDRNGAFSGPAHRIGQLEVLRDVREAGGDRVAIYDIENEAGTPIYVHAKVVVIDDVFAAIGSDNMNRRSWTHDSELSIAVLDEERDDRDPADPAGLGDGARRFARDLRLRLWREHLGTEGDDELVDPDAGFAAWRAAAETLDAWHEGGRQGPRPPGRVRAHRPREVHPWEVWGVPLYRMLVDPDGRPGDLKRAGRF
jgi:phosphatidylserine/phosphatidylglycerophosphate/cardiolipin synthase-like enzyme